jgi:hypothetical protein
MAAYDPSAKDAPQPIGQDGLGAGEGERVAKALARAGAASRREVERLIEQGRVDQLLQATTTNRRIVFEQPFVELCSAH